MYMKSTGINFQHRLQPPVMLLLLLLFYQM